MNSVSTKFITGSALMFSVQFLQRSIGLISTLILARLLTPQDFGTVAIVAITLQIFQILSDTGSRDYIIQKQKVDSEDLDNAWTINILLKAALFLLLQLSAPYIATYFNNADLTDALRVSSFVLIINAIDNPALHMHVKAIDYKRLFNLMLIQKAISFIIVICLAFFSRNFWAIIWGDIVAAVVMAIGSYFIDTYRPRLTTSRLLLQWNFSKWVFLKGILGVLRSQLDTLFTSKLYDKSSLGLYHVTKGVAFIPCELITPILSPTTSALSQCNNSFEEFSYRFRLCLLGTVLLTFPCAIYLNFFALEIVTVLLGKQWIGGIEILECLALLFATTPINQLAYASMTANGRVKDLFVYDLASLIFVFVCLLFLPKVSLEAFALARSLLAIFTTFTFYFYINSVARLYLQKLLKPILMVFVLSYICGQFSLHITNILPIDDLIILRLCFSGILFGVTYCSLLFSCSLLLKDQSTEAYYFKNIALNYYAKGIAKFASR